MQASTGRKRWLLALAFVVVLVVGAVIAWTMLPAKRKPAAAPAAGHAGARIDPAYLDVDAAGAGTFNGEWDIPVGLLAARFHLPRGADGDVSFETLKPHFHEMARRAYDAITFSDGNTACVVSPQRVEEANRGGAEEYLVLMFGVVCPDPPVHALTIGYRLFMAPHSSQSAILVVHHDGATDSAFFTPKRQKTTVALDASGAAS